MLPILHRGRLVGRLDPKADRRTRAMIIRAIWLEPRETLSDDLVAGIAGALREFLIFHGTESLVIERCEPTVLREILLERIDVSEGAVGQAGEA